MLRPEICPASLIGCLDHSVCILRDDRISTHFEFVFGMFSFRGGLVAWKMETVYFDQILILNNRRTLLLLLIAIQGAHPSFHLKIFLVFHEALHACYARIVLKRV